MSPKKENLSPKNKEDSLKKEKSLNQRNLQKEKPDKKSLPLMAEDLPSASTSVPLVSREIPLVSGYVPLVSSRPPITLPRYWGLMPSRKWGKTTLPSGRKKVLRPTDTGLFKFLGKVATAPWQPVEMVKGLAERVKKIDEEERDIKAQFEKELLELKMLYEMEEISEEKYKRERSKLKKG